jgi:Flp pilus assembly protein TadG
MQLLRRIRGFVERLHRDESGAATLEMALLAAAVIIPSVYVIDLAMDVIISHYRMITFINSLPFP